MPMPSIAERNQRRELRAFVAIDTIDVIAERITNLARSGRLCTIVFRYDSSKEVEVNTGLSLDTGARNGGVHPFTQTEPVGRGVSVYLRPGIRSYGLSAYADDGLEEAVRERFHAEQPRDATYVVITGGSTSDGRNVGREDSIQITRYNEHGVGMFTTIAFALVEGKDRAEADAQVLDQLVASAPEGGWSVEALTALAESVRYDWRTLEDRAEEASTEAPAEVSSTA